MKCRKCQFENPAGSKFCNECGSKLEIACSQCSHVNPAGSKFCNKCGLNLAQPSTPSESSQALKQTDSPSALPEAAPLPEGERRQATIVFSDLSGYTSMNEQLDPEEVEAIMSRIKKEAVIIVERHEGIVNQFVGDEVLALFGIPAAHEDDPMRAVRGKTKPLIPYHVTGESAVQTRFEAAKIQGLTTFTGREQELTTLYACLDKTLAGKGQFVTVLGEAGLGKSRLTYEFRHSLNKSAITVLLL